MRPFPDFSTAIRTPRLMPVAAIFFCLAMGLQLYFWIGRDLHPDEVETLYSAWLMSQGQVPYRDFLQVHTPFFYFLLAPLFLMFKTSSVFFAGRLLMCGLVLMNAFFVFLIAKRLCGQRAALFSLLSYFASIPILSQMTQILPDAMVVIFSNLSLVFLLTHAGQGSISFLASGCFAGLAVLSKQSGLIYMLGALLILVYWELRRNAEGSGGFQTALLSRTKHICWFLLGAFIPLGCLAAYLFLNKAVAPFLKYAVLNDFLRTGLFLKPESLHWLPWKNLGHHMILNAIQYILSLLGVGLLFFAKDHKRMRFFIILPLVSFLFLFRILHPWPRELLMFSQYQILLSGIALDWLFTLGFEKIQSGYQKIFAVMIFFLIVFLLYVGPSIATVLEPNRSPKTAEVFQHFWDRTKPGDRFLSIKKAFLFRPSVYFWEVGDMFAEQPSTRGIFDEALSQNILNDEIVVIRYHPYFQEYYQKTDRLIREFYVKYRGSALVIDETGTQSFYIPGQRIKLISSREASLEILVSGHYRIQKNASLAVVVNGQEVNEKIFYLPKGRHILKVSETPAEFLLVYDLNRKMPS